MTTEQKRFTLELSEQEGSALLQLLDAAVKAQGLAVAGTAAMLCQKIQTAHAASQQQLSGPKAVDGALHSRFEEARPI